MTLERRFTGPEIEAVRERLKLSMGEWASALRMNRETYRKITLKPGAKQFREPSENLCLKVREILRDIKDNGLKATRLALLEKAEAFDAEKADERDRAEFERLRKKFEGRL